MWSTKKNSKKFKRNSQSPFSSYKTSKVSLDTGKLSKKHKKAFKTCQSLLHPTTMGNHFPSKFLSSHHNHTLIIWHAICHCGWFFCCKVKLRKCNWCRCRWDKFLLFLPFQPTNENQMNEKETCKQFYFRGWKCGFINKNKSF